jgi:phospholipase/carboxylesterase
MSTEQLRDIAGLRTTVAGSADAPVVLVLLHGYAMQPSDLSPFAHSLKLPVLFLLPRGPVSSPLGGQAWWEVDLDSREAALASGPRDLFDYFPSGLPAARRVLGQFLDIVTTEYQPRRIILGGFSQGGMLSLDWALRGSRPVDGLVLLSASRLGARDWEPHRQRLRNLPVFVSHGEADQDLSFSAGECLRDFVLQSAARTTWVPFPGGHEIPLVVWRALRKFVSALLE